MEISEDEWIDLHRSIQETIYDLFEENILHMCNPNMQKELCNEVMNIFLESIGEDEYEEEFYEELQELIEQIFDAEMESMDVPKRALTMTIETMNYMSNEHINNLQTQIDLLRDIPQPAQKSKEWYEFRYNLISASNLWKIFSSQSQQNSLIYEKCKPFDISKYETMNTFTSGSLHWGVKYEPVTTMIYEELYQTKVEEFGCIQHPEYNFIGASPDGINVDNTNNKFGRMLEIKNIVNREITGIPKMEYWIQTQIQMETCNLELCDFVETRFKEYDTSGDFYNDESEHEYKGIILHFIEQPIISDDCEDFSHIKPTAPHYVYMPVQLEITKQSVEIWIQNTKVEMRSRNLTWFNTIYWYLDEYSCVTIPRNKRWFQNAIEQIKDCWDIILKERENGYEHRAAKKRATTEITLDASGNIYKTNIKKNEGVCLIKMDENGNLL